MPSLLLWKVIYLTAYMRNQISINSINTGNGKKKAQAAATVQPLVFTRADPVALAAFDPATKQCMMNCGQHRDDPRSMKECMFLCGDCWPIEPTT